VPDLVVPQQRVVDTLERVASDIKGFCAEKYGAYRDILVEGDASRRACCRRTPSLRWQRPSRTPCSPIIDAHGEWDLDDAPPITLSVNRVGSEAPAAGAAPQAEAVQLWQPPRSCQSQAPAEESARPDAGLRGGGACVLRSAVRCG